MARKPAVSVTVPRTPSGVLLAGLVLMASAVGYGQSAPAEPGKPPPSAFDEWVKQTKNPTPWLSWGADFRARETYYNNIANLNKDLAGHEYHWQQYRTRLWSTVQPIPNCKDFDINARVVWEFKNYCLPHGPLRDTDVNEALFDNLNVKYRNAFNLPMTIIVGRQDIILGDGWLVQDGTPLDGSRTAYFDAARATTEFKDIKTTVDTIYIQQYGDEDKWIEPFNSRNAYVAEQNSKGAILWVANKSVPRNEVDGYFIYKKDKKLLANGNDADIYTVGARGAGAMTDNWKYSAEIAQQTGHKNGHDLCALGANTRLGYFFNDPLNNNLRLSYEFLSGDDPDTQTNEAFDPLWARYARFTELVTNTYAIETRIAEVTNLHRLGPGWGFNPCKQLEFSTDYYLLFADENTKAGSLGFSQNGNFRGQLWQAVMKYKFNNYVSGHLWGELFAPGNYYTDYRNDVAAFLRYELVFTW